mmetsp:Transcript_38794/g.101425  ORF Transcript_38794/g.101425 Transcript_38794/m.101425 type:complete len:276 (+) Transcript_38794:289-1116(+)
MKILGVQPQMKRTGLLWARTPLGSQQAPSRVKRRWPRRMALEMAGAMELASRVPARIFPDPAQGAQWTAVRAAADWPAGVPEPMPEQVAACGLRQPQELPPGLPRQGRRLLWEKAKPQARWRIRSSPRKLHHRLTTRQQRQAGFRCLGTSTGVTLSIQNLVQALRCVPETLLVSAKLSPVPAAKRSCGPREVLPPSRCHRWALHPRHTATSNNLRLHSRAHRSARRPTPRPTWRRTGFPAATLQARASPSRSIVLRSALRLPLQLPAAGHLSTWT